MWIVEVSVIGLSCWAGPLICGVVAYDEFDPTISVKHIEQMSVREIDKSNTFQADIIIRSRGVSSIQLPPEAKVKHVCSKGYLSFSCPWTIKSCKTDPRIAYEYAKSKHDDIMKEYDERFPGWGFSRHKGEGTPEHRRLILSKRAGTNVHRRSFMPLARFYSTERKTDSGYIPTHKSFTRK